MEMLQRPASCSGIIRGLASLVVWCCAFALGVWMVLFERILVSSFCSVAVSSLVLVGADRLRTPCSHLVWFGELRWR